MYPIIFVTGPTATGKTEVSFLLAKELKGEVVSCDSMLVYKEPKIITSKPKASILKSIPHHFIGIVSAKEAYNVFDYYASATSKITSLFNKNIPVVICGGSGLYLKAILDGIFEGVGKDENLRKTLKEKADIYGKKYLYEELKKLDPPTAKKLSPNDLKRIIRALEVYYLSGTPISKRKAQSHGIYGNLPMRIFGLRLKRDALYQRINTRVEEMFKKGAIEEVKQLLKLNLSISAKQIIGIKGIKEFLGNKTTQDCAKENIKKNTRHFAKRQLTWFRKEKRIEWVDIDNLNPEQVKGEIMKRVLRNTLPDT